ncbi:MULTISPECIES: ATP-binding protein [Actinomycetes]|uniref:ATP-binding protein n=1 Tax=Actinomycetes TaxID=1760 RepID=UPI001319F7A5|nr:MULTISPECIES: ATP-binding protein [Actinomycetes]
MQTPTTARGLAGRAVRALSWLAPVVSPAMARQTREEVIRLRGEVNARRQADAEAQDRADTDTALVDAVIAQLKAYVHGEQPPYPGEFPASSAKAGLVERLLDDVRDRADAARDGALALATSWQNAAHRIHKQAEVLFLAGDLDDAGRAEIAYRISHLAAQQAHRTQSLAVLLDGWLGQQWQHPLSLADVVRAATGRIEAYQRVTGPDTADTAVVAHAVEPVIHIVAALLANATQASPPSSKVAVTITPVDCGYAIEVRDDGNGLGDDRLRWADDRASGRVPVGLPDLGTPPQTGLAAVGRLAHEHGIAVRLGRSVQGGLAAAVTVPRHLLVSAAECEPPEPPRPRRDPAPSTLVPQAPLPAPESRAVPTTPGGLPRRSRSAPAAQPAARTPAGTPPRPQSPAEAAAFYGELVDGAPPATAASDPARPAPTPEDTP